MLVPEQVAGLVYPRETLGETESFKCMSSEAIHICRYPRLMEHAYDEAVPYVWWSRGNYGLSKVAFLHLVEKHTGKISMLS